MTHPEFPASAPSPGVTPDAWAQAAVMGVPVRHRAPSRGRQRAMVAIAAVGVFVVAPIAGHLASTSRGPAQSTSVLTQLPSANATSSVDVASIAAQVEPSVVNFTLSEEAGGQAAGTDIVVSFDGLVLTIVHPDLQSQETPDVNNLRQF